MFFRTAHVLHNILLTAVVFAAAAATTTIIWVGSEELIIYDYNDFVYIKFISLT
jgi:hypothetical protein